MRPLPVKILGMGTELPERVVDNAELEDRLRLSAGWIKRRTGIRARRHAPAGTVPSTLALPACQEALRDAGLDVADLDLIIFASAVDEQVIPSTAVFLQHRLGDKARGIPCFDVDATCLSFVVGLNTAACMIAAGQIRHALVATAEVASAGIDYEQPASACLFGDGAAAFVLGPSEGASCIERFAMRTYSEHRSLSQIRFGLGELPEQGVVDDKSLKFQMDGPSLFRVAAKVGEDLLHEFWQGNPAPETFDAIVPHQTNKHGIRLVARMLGFPRERVMSNVEQYGNMVSASIPVAFAEAVWDKKIQRGHRVMLFGTAAGLSFAHMNLVY